MARKKLEVKEEGLSRGQLVKALKSVLPGIEKRNTLSGLDTVFFDNDWVRTFNNQISISYPVDVGIKCAIRMEELFKVLSQMEGERVSIKLSSEGKKEKAIFQDEKTTLKMALREDISFDEQISSLQIPSPDDKDEWKEIPSDFVEGTALCLWSAAIDLINGALAGIYFENEFVYASDNNRLSRYEMGSSLETSFILPTLNVGNFLRIGEVSTHFCENQSWVHFLCESGVVVSIRRLIGDYPSAGIDEHFDRFKDGDFYTFPEGLEASIDRAWVLAEIQSEEIGLMAFIYLKRKKKELIIVGKKDIGEVTDHIPWDCDIPENIEIMINPKFLKRIIMKTKDFKISEDGGTLFFESDKFKHIVAVKVTEA